MPPKGQRPVKPIPAQPKATTPPVPTPAPPTPASVRAAAAHALQDLPAPNQTVVDDLRLHYADGVLLISSSRGTAQLYVGEPGALAVAGVFGVKLEEA